MFPTTFQNYLHNHLEISEEQTGALLEHCQLKTVAKGDILLREGDYSKYVFFVEEGLLRQYSLDEKGREHIMMFAPENWFVGDRESIFFDRPSLYSIQALENTKVTLIDQNLIRILTQKIPGFADFNNRLLHNHVRHLQKRIDLLLSATAENRYLRFIEMYPDILLRVPQTMIASYLGITPESLSRVRKELAENNFKES